MSLYPPEALVEHPETFMRMVFEQDRPAWLAHQEEALRESEQRMQLATDSAQLAIWDWDLQAGTMIWDDRMFELYGTTRLEINGTCSSGKPA